MRAWRINDEFGLDNFKLTDLPDPKPGHGEVLIKVMASSLNYRDLITIDGAYGPAVKAPIIPSPDGAGEVVEVGEGVSGLTVGDRVATMFFQTWQDGPPSQEKQSGALGAPLDGTMTEMMVLPEKGVVKIPDYMTYLEAATLPCAALTAWSALVTEGNIRAGDTVVMQGTGGVSLFALQIAKMHGVRTIITSSSDEKLERAKALGADEVINYRTNPDWDKAVKKMTNGVGADHIIEVGGAETLGKAVRAVRVGGTVSLIGVLSGAKGEFPLPLVLMRNVRIQGITVGSREGFVAMVKAMAQHEMHPVVDKVYPFEEAIEGLNYLKSGKHFGKICLDHS
ncbi:MAG: NAD(P)-dependent alcohol dehydrogenase [Rhodospirillales bacterium]|nr:NAD(P)-dependent alcohol dehydrogenase [Rhodospirillales bacterium]